MHFEMGFSALFTLLLLPAALLVAALALERKTFTLRTTTKHLLRVLALACLCIALAGPRIESSSEESGALVLADISESIDPAAGEDLLSEAKRLTPDGETKILPFSGTASRAPTSFSTSETFSRLKETFSQLNLGETNLEQALARVLAEPASETSGVKPIVLVSDGYETQGNALELIPALQAAHIALFPLVPSLDKKSSSQFSISNLSAPLVAPSQKSVPIKVSVQNTSSETQSGTLKIVHEEHVLLEKQITVFAGQELLFETDSDPSQDGIKKVRATLTPTNPDFRPSEWRAFLSGETREKILILHGDSEDKRFLDEALKGQSYQVQALVGAPRFASLPEFKDFSAVVFNNVALEQLPSGTLQSLDAFVRNGGGFIMTGGNRGYGLGGYIGSKMEAILPVIMIPPQAEQKRLNVAVQLVIDKSQSMSRDQRLEFAKEASRQVVENLKDEDYIGVIGFDETPWEVLRTTQVGGNRDFAVERIGRLFPKGQTWLLPALREARRRLEATPAGRKHIIIVTDGELKDAGPIYLEDVRQARLSGITVSTVLIGGEFDFGFLRSLSEAGGGSFYSASDPSQLPRIFMEDVKVRSGEKTLREEREFQVRPGQGEVRSTQVRAFPPLRGYVETKAKPDANYELAVVSGAEGRPLLASWQLEKGKVAAFTSDANGRWSSNWIGWPRYAEFWSNLLDSVRPEQGGKGTNVRFDLRRFVERGALTLDVAVFQDLGAARIQAEVVGADGSTREVTLEPVSRGRYQVSLPKAQAGTYQVKLKASGGAQPYNFTPVAFDVSGELFGERKGLGFNTSLLERLARETGGKVNPSYETLSGLKRTTVTRVELGAYFLLAALAFFLIQIFLRERRVTSSKGPLTLKAANSAFQLLKLKLSR
jgi:hypothetical protein